MTSTRATSVSFSDIANHWAKDCILALAQRNIVNGYPDGTFRPDATLTRAEFAALMFNAFPNAPAQREPVSFSDVPSTHWANQAIQWGYTRGFFSGFPDGTFQPNQAISRLQAVLVLVSTQAIDNPANPDEQLRLFFADAGQIPEWAKRAISDAIVANLIVNYPDVRQLRPNQAATRGETSALLCRTLRIPNTVPAQYAVWNWGIYDIKGEVKAPFATWKGSGRLMRDIQVILVSFRLYPGNKINGEYNWETEKAMTTFCSFYGLPNMQTGIIDEPFAWALLNADPVEFIMANAKDRQQVYNEFLKQEAGFDASKLAFLDRGIEKSPYRNDVPAYPDRLTQKPNGTQLASLGSQVTLVNGRVVSFNTYPAVGVRPAIDGGLEFLHSDIQQACIAVGSIVDGKMRAHWSGRDPIKGIQHWSTTKIIPLLNVVSRANAVQPAAKVRDCLVRSGSSGGYGFYNLAVDLVNYGNTIASSNSIAAMFKQFATPAELDGWLKQMTGNSGIEFRGRYGEAPFIQSPNLYHQPSRSVVLNSRSTSHTGNNFISAYDLTRMVSMLGWHVHLSQESKFPAAQWDSLETVVRAMGVDTARYIDVAIDRLGLNTVIEAPVIISKLGFGRSSSRNRTEISYVALLQFTDTRPRRQSKPAIQYTIALTLLGAKGLNDANEEARQLDARLAAEVTEILRRIVSRELA
jgi:peptidoglycan hydrolase-like protein with peptidoglycan-binding domain